MGNIISSVLAASVQKDGTESVHEVHTDLVGATHDISYFAASDADLNGAMAQHATDMGNNLEDNEVQTNIANILALGSLASPTFVYSTAAENILALRTAYKSATQIQAVMLGDFLNTLTSNQLQVAFGLTAGQVTTLRSNKLAPAAAVATSIRSAAGQ